MIKELENMKAGDIISVRRIIGYSHFGVYVGDGMVVHFTGERKGELNPRKARIIKTSMKYFQRRGKVKVVNKGKRFDCEEIVERAEWMVGKGKGKYGLTKCNCEHFARWCESGDARSDQVEYVVEKVSRFPLGKMLARSMGLA